MNSVTDTAQAFGSIINGVNALTGMNLAQIGLLFVGILAGVLSTAGVAQHLLEIVYTYVPGLPFWVKPMLPKALSALVGWMLKASGMDTATAASLAGTLMLTIEGVNNSPLALDLESKVSAAKAGMAQLAASKPATGGAPRSAFGFLLVAFLGLGAGLHSATMSIGSIPLSPTAGPLSVVVEPLVAATFYRAGAGAILTPETDAVGGLQVIAAWGSYGAGLAAAVDKDTDNATIYGAAGVVGLTPYGEAFVLWRDSGALLGVTFPWSLGASVTP